MNYKVITEDSNISLHDHLVSEIQVGRDIALLFEDGFDVTVNNIYNNTGRHKLTGKSAVILYEATYIEGSKFLSDNNEKKIEVSSFSKLDLEVLDFSYDSNTDIVEVYGEAWDESVFCKLKFKVTKVTYCWNEFVDDAWFQDWPS
ncbi:hypothetical protein SAMN02745136_05675 [Anaerocolumna jejuensis DSM 15929]|uniref:Uncharacterized protein n=1 Tax=Anaerocolumna jejuensis DSM 15929 TaxID=1121322 RepID=A0A1M7DDM7_9FIRM|nr:hypothetical protein [Anaerocolumna jejuensis]SHL77636.1 hypothetical protein SAMN02745136_05675 [Anaerocolumna jejuensis DSM 15929]